MQDGNRLLKVSEFVTRYMGWAKHGIGRGKEVRGGQELFDYHFNIDRE